MDVSIAAGANAPAPGTPSPSATGSEGEDRAYVTENSLKELLEKHTSDLLAHVGRQVKAIKDSLPPPPAEPQPKGGQPSDDSTSKTLKDRLALLEERDAKQRVKALRSGLRDALVSAGASPRLAELTVPALLEMEGNNFKVSEDALTGDLRVSYGEDTLDTWAKLYMAGEDGKQLANPNPSPSLRLPSGSNEAGGPKRQVPFSEVSSLSDEELESGRIQLIPG